MSTTNAGSPTSTRTPRSLGDLPIAARILLTVSVTALAGGAASGFALTQLGASAARTHTLYTQHLRDGISTITSISEEVRDARIAMYVMAVSGKESVIAEQKKSIEATDAKIAAQVEAYRATTADPQTLKAFEQTWAEYRKARDERVMPLAARTDLGAVREFDAARTTYMTQLTGPLTQQLAKLVQAESEQARMADAASTQAYRRARLAVLAALVTGFGLAIAIAFVVARRMGRTAVAVSHVAEALRRGDLTVRSGVSARDELGRMAGDLDGAAEILRTTISDVVATSHTVAASAEQLSGATTHIAAQAQRSSEQVAAVSTGCAEVGANVQSLAGATEQMTSSIRNIASNAASAARTAEEAGAEVERIQAAISTLGESSARIGTVVNLISSIAEQTNLLALNATIEAARAGEAGKGFAVVANEVKDLANQTASATTDISDQVETIQRDVSASVEAIGRIVGTVADINAIQTAIAGAVEEQSATTQDIARAVHDAAAGSGHISSTIAQVADAATNTSTGVGQARSATEDLARTAADLRRLTSTFRY